MNITVIGSGNSGLTMAAHLSQAGENVSLWNRSTETIGKLIKTNTVHCRGLIDGPIRINLVTNNIKSAIEDPDIIFITTPASSHREIAKFIAENIEKETLIILNPGRTFGALEFRKVYNQYNKEYKQRICETQTIIYTCRKTAEDAVNLISLKSDVLLSCIDQDDNCSIIKELPEAIQEYFYPAKSMVETSIGNVGMILHCAPLLLNAGWTENDRNIYKYYYDGISPSVGRLIEKIDAERVAVSKALGCEVETTMEWLKRTYHTSGDSLYECIQNNEAYTTIDAPSSLKHRYIFEDIPCGLVPLESTGKRLGLEMKTTSLIIDLANTLIETDFRKTGRNLNDFTKEDLNDDLKKLFKKE